VAQLTGFCNYSRSVDGLQAAGFMNVATGTVRGIQAAGFLNFAREVKGVQLAVINIADTVSSGAPIGLINFVVKGYHTVEISANELFPANLTLKTGTRHFYNILTAGIQQDIFSVGYGIGTQFRLAKRLTFSMDVTGNYLADNQDFLRSLASQVKLSTTFDIEIARHFKLIFGPVLSGFAGLDSANSNTVDLPFLFSYPVKNLMVGTTPVSIRIGAMAGFRF
jgi:hypothetical protein